MSRNFAPASIIPVSHPNGVTLNVQLVLEKKQTRQQQKLKTLTKYVEKYPSGWKKRLELAKLLYSMGKWARATEELSRVVERRPISVEARLLLGKLWQLSGQETKAISLYESTLPLVRNKATHHHIIGLIAQCRHCPQKAVYPFERATMSEPENIAHWLALGKLQLSLDSPKAALRAFDTLLSLQPEEVTALIYSYDTLMQLGQDSSAQKRLNQALALAPGDFRVLVRLASRRCQQRLVFEKSGRQTQQLIFKALRLSPQTAQTHHLLANYHRLRREQPQAKAVLHRFTKQYPEQPYGWVYYAQLLFQLGDVQVAAEAILRAYDLYRGDHEIYRTLCDILPAAGQVEILRPILQEMPKAFPESWQMWATAGRVWIEHYHQSEKGIAASTKATELQPELAAAWFCHGQVLMLAEQYLSAVEALEYGWQLGEKEGRSRLSSVAMWLSESYEALGQKVSSQQWLAIAVDSAEVSAENEEITRYSEGRVARN